MQLKRKRIQGSRIALRGLSDYRLAELIANKLRLMEEVDYRRQGQQLEERVSESAEAMRNISAFQLMTQADLSQPQVGVTCKHKP